MRAVHRMLLAAAGCAALAACGHSSPAPEPTPTPTCTYAISPSNVSVASAGGASTIAVDATAGCAWSATSDGPWVHVTAGASGSGPGTITLRIDENAAEAARTAHLTIATASATVLQDGRTACSYTLEPQSRSVGASGGSSAFDVRTTAECSWKAESNAAWVDVRSPVAETKGSGHVELGVDPNTAEQERTATVTAAGRTFTLTQGAASPTPLCTYSVSPTEFELHWHGPGGEFQVATDKGCAWTISAEESWITLEGPQSRSGPGTAKFSVSQFLQEAERAAPVKVRWQTESAGQNVWVTQSGCRYAVAPSEVSVTAAGGHLRADVFGDPFDNTCAIGCPWTAVSRSTWIHIATAMPSAGDNSFFYDVDANTGVARQGTIVAGGRVLTVTQSAP